MTSAARFNHQRKLAALIWSSPVQKTALSTTHVHTYYMSDPFLLPHFSFFFFFTPAGFTV
jgi:hypothetical protein